jgi:NAD(P)-dependent dehydrogenase (short-subunit alcohol dehydrogenase family)
MTTAGPLQGQSVLVVGRGGGIARAVTLAAAYAGEPAIGTRTVDLTDEASIAALGEQIGRVDHVVSTASARARGRLADLDREALRLSFDTKVLGPILLAKHLAPRMNEDGRSSCSPASPRPRSRSGRSGWPSPTAPPMSWPAPSPWNWRPSGSTPSPPV